MEILGIIIEALAAEGVTLGSPVAENNGLVIYSSNKGFVVFNSANPILAINIEARGEEIHLGAGCPKHAFVLCNPVTIDDQTFARATNTARVI